MGPMKTGRNRLFRNSPGTGLVIQFAFPLWNNVRKTALAGPALQIVFESSGKDPTAVRVEDFRTYDVEDLEAARTAISKE
jgi:hypothetical protein